MLTGTRSELRSSQTPNLEHKEYVSPYDLRPPLDYIIIHNRSRNAADAVISQLKDAWPDLKIIHVVQNDRDPLPYVDGVVRINNWTDMDHFKDQFDQLARENPELRQSMAAGKVGFYCAWSTAAEKSSWAKEAENKGFKWIGASPDKLNGLDKLSYKKLAQHLGLPTADFVEVKAPPVIDDKEETLRQMAQQLVDLYKQSPLAGKAIFVKHNEGGGGRGSKKVAVVTFDSALEALRKDINECGGDFNGMYFEESMDWEGAQLLQLELEVDGKKLAPGGRLVFFNQENQKVLELGFTDEAISKVIPKEIYEQCRIAAAKISEATGYDNRGTNEFLIVRDKFGKWYFKLLEFNKRIQVEHQALSALVTDAKGRPKNIPAEQVMRSMGYPPPSEKDYRFTGHQVVAHLRLLSCQITPHGTSYPLGLKIDGALYPPGTDIQFVKGDVFLDADPQLGRALFKGQTLEEVMERALHFVKNVQFIGPKTEESTYFDFFRKLFSDPNFRAGKLGCNETFKVLANPPVEPGKVQKIAGALASTVTPLVTHGYRTGEGVKDQPYPTPSQIKEFTEFMEGLRFEKIPETAFSWFLKHHDYHLYIKELKAELAQHGGGTVTVIRDVLQSAGDQESALVQKAAVKLAEIFLARSGIGVGFEEGGAQYQAGLMRNFDWMEVLLAGCPANMAPHSLTRSKWVNGLTPKTPEEQRFVFETIAKEVANHYGCPPESAPFIPWFPYNFHAGNHPEQDLTTHEMLKAGLGVMPNWAWDPRYSEADFRGWVKRQIDLFQKANKPLCQIRIKNPGQGSEWTSKTIVKHVEIIRQMFKEHKLEEPIIYIHNHEFDGKAAHIAAKALKKCQELGYRYLVVDSAPPGTPHNSNLIISEALDMTEEERENLALYNHGTQLLLNLTSRFNNQKATNEYLDPKSTMAGGTVSSDLADALKYKIPPRQMERLKVLVKDLIGLGTPVTPYSEWIKQIGFAIWLNADISPKTLETVEAYIMKGGKLEIAPNILEGLRAWKTLLPRKPIVAQLLKNHGLPPNPEEKEEPAAAPLNIEALRKELQTQFPNIIVNDRVLCTVIAFDNIGREFIKRRAQWAAGDKPKDMTLMMTSPAFTHSQFKEVGDSFYLYGEKITIARMQRDEKQGCIYVDYYYQGHTLRCKGSDPNKQAKVAAEEKQFVKDKEKELGAKMAGSVVTLFAKPGQRVRKGDPLVEMEIMKMRTTILADEDLQIDSVKTFDPADKGHFVDTNEVLMRFHKP